MTAEEETAITAALAKYPHASAVARASKGAWSYSTVWRVAKRAGIALTAGRETMGRHRVTAEQRAKVIAARQENPRALQRQIAEQAGVSRPTVSRVERGDCRRCGDLRPAPGS